MCVRECAFYVCAFVNSKGDIKGPSSSCFYLLCLFLSLLLFHPYLMEVLWRRPVVTTNQVNSCCGFTISDGWYNGVWEQVYSFRRLYWLNCETIFGWIRQFSDLSLSAAGADLLRMLDTISFWLSFFFKQFCSFFHNILHSIPAGLEVRRGTFLLPFFFFATTLSPLHTCIIFHKHTHTHTPPYV